MRATVDPKITEEFLLTQDEIQDASVWISGHKLHAHVTHSFGYAVSEGRLKQVCQELLGEEQTPVEIILIPQQKRA